MNLYNLNYFLYIYLMLALNNKLKNYSEEYSKIFLISSISAIQCLIFNGIQSNYPNGDQITIFSIILFILTIIYSILVVLSKKYFQIELFKTISSIFTKIIYTIFILVIMYSIMKYFVEINEINCLNGYKQCQNYCNKQNNLNNTCLRQQSNQKYNLNTSEINKSCNKFKNQEFFTNVCLDQFLTKNEINFTDGMINNNICYYYLNENVHCLNQNLIPYRNKSIIKITTSDNFYAGIDDKNKLFHNIDLVKDRKIFNFPNCVIEQIIQSKIIEAKLTNDRLCIKDIHHNLICSGNQIDRSNIASGGKNYCYIKSPINQLWCSTLLDLTKNGIPDYVNKNILSVAVGHFHVCALHQVDKSKSLNLLLCWGQNIFDQTEIPDDFLMETEKVFAGHLNTCVISYSKEMFCFGKSNDYLHPPYYLQQYVVNITLGIEHSCVLQEDPDSGEIIATCWGANKFGQVHVPVDQIYKVKEITAGDYHTCILIKKDGILCFGLNDIGQTNVPGDISLKSSVMVQAGSRHSCALDSKTKMQCWGASIDINGPFGKNHEQIAVTLGSNLTCAIDNRGQFQCWDAIANGVGSKNAIYLGTTPQQYTFLNVDKFSVFEKSLAFSSNDSEQITFASLVKLESKLVSSNLVDFCIASNLICYIKPINGNLMMHEFGCQKESSLLEESVKRVIRQKELSCGFSHGCVIWSDGELTCLGGSEEQKEAHIPEEMKYDNQKVKAGKNFSCVINKEHKINCWGKELNLTDKISFEYYHDISNV